MDNQKTVFLDAGHGGIDPDGNYTTAPAKMYNHKSGVFHDGGCFYEGVFNRQVTNALRNKLNQFGIRTIDVHHAYADTPLQGRVDAANFRANYIADSIYVSNHANASTSHRARGFEIYSSVGTTKSDRLADLIFESIKKQFGNRLRYRTDYADGDPDKEAQFFVLRKTTMPSVLVENLFFDQPDDAQLLIDPLVINEFAEAQFRGIVEYFFG